MKRRGDSSASTIEIAVDHIGADAIVRSKGRVDVDSSPDVRDRLRDRYGALNTNTHS
jgi:hypothetical protein